MAEELSQFADYLENAEDFDAALQKLISKALTDHQRIIFNGNGYSKEWQEEAARRGLSNLPSTAKALPRYISPKNLELVTRHGIFTEAEFRARYEIHLQSYNKLIHIEARTMVDMVMHQILPAAIKYSSDLAESINRKRSAFGSKVSATAESSIASRISECCDKLYDQTESLHKNLKGIPNGSSLDAAQYCSDVIVPKMEKIRKSADLLEKLTPQNYWPYPIYSDLLFY